MTPVTHLQPKGTHTPLIEYLNGAKPSRRGLVRSEKPQEGPISSVCAVRDTRDASVVIGEEIEAVMRNYDFLTLAQVRMARIAFCRYMMARYRVRFCYRQARMLFPSSLVA